MVLETASYGGGYQQKRYSAYQGSNGGYNTYQSVTDYSTPYSGLPSGGDYYGNGANHPLGGGMGVPLNPIGGYESSYNSYTYGNLNNRRNSPHQTHASLHDSDHQSYESSHGQVYGASHPQGHGSPHGQVYGGSHPQGHESPHGRVYGGSHPQGHGSPHGQVYGGSHPQSHGSPHGHDYGGSHNTGHGSPHSQGYGSHQEFGKTHGIGGAITHQINKPAHGYEKSSHANFVRSSSGYGHGYGNSSLANNGHNNSGFSHGYQKPSWTVKGLNDDDDE